MIENSRYHWSKLKTRTVTVSVRPQEQQTGIVFKVSKMIDLGNGRQTIVLTHLDYPETKHCRASRKGISVPMRMGQLDFLYTSRQNPTVQNVGHLIAQSFKGAQVEKIVPDVLCPGDLLVFKPQSDGVKIKMVSALRIVKDNTYTEGRVGHAL